MSEHPILLPAVRPHVSLQSHHDIMEFISLQYIATVVVSLGPNSLIISYIVFQRQNDTPVMTRGDVPVMTRDGAPVMTRADVPVMTRDGAPVMARGDVPAMTRDDPEEKLVDELIATFSFFSERAAALRFIHGGDVPHVTELPGRQHQERVTATACLFFLLFFSNSSLRK